MPEKLDKETFDQLVDVVLEYGGKPRRWLFEFPYREDESRQIIQIAEDTVRRMLGIINA